MTDTTTTTTMMMTRLRGALGAASLLALLSLLALGAGACGGVGPEVPKDTASGGDTAIADTSTGTDTVASDVTDTVGDDDTAADTVSPGDTGGADTSGGDEVYGPVAPPDDVVPPALQGQTWVDHWTTDIAPYWTMSAALGSPAGNYPTYRDMNGNATGSTKRRPRMLSRQIYAYSMGYALTGDTSLLAHAKAGVDWLIGHAIDKEKGGCFEQLNADGSAVAGQRPVQDFEYCMMGLGAWFFVTRDPAAEAELLRARDLIFDPAVYWDATKGRVKDGLADDMATEIDVENDGGSELVAQLDAVNAFMLLVQPVLTDPSDRQRFLASLRTLGDVMVRDFHQDGLFWGVSTNKGKYGTKHVDFGHILKSFWMLLEVDKRVASHPFHELVMDEVYAVVDRAWDSANGRWAKRPTSATAVEYGSDWWIYAEEDQIAGVLDLIDWRFLDRRAQTQAHWLEDYVDDVYA
ncbi:MAG: AGE family epimerase/isomerase, partial [Myxococcales bacterium]|nr:AGE family epimerase/isomerase [Myxococcales bacterium]